MKQRCGSSQFIEINDKFYIKTSEYLSEIKAGKTCWGIKQIGEKERQRERNN